MRSAPPPSGRGHERFRGVPSEHNTVEASAFFDRTFDGVLAWGLLFLLTPAAQALVIEKVARALDPGGRFLIHGA